MTVTPDQSEVIAFLGNPETHGGHTVERIDTHSAAVFLAGDRAWKPKRAVAFPFLDFSTPERRGKFCRKEVELNQRTAPDLYLRAVPIVRGEDGNLMLGDADTGIDWVVEMKRFEQEQLFDNLADTDTFSPDLMTDLADTVARFHNTAEALPDYGGAAAIRWVIDDNLEELTTFDAVFDTGEIEVLGHRTRAVFKQFFSLLNRRRSDGHVRRCHGDLHLQNICLIDGRPTPFDCIEFNDDIACVDTMYDLAFLLMDLDRHGRRREANIVLNRYLARTGDFGALPALPLFLACRATVKAKVTAIAAESHHERRDEARAFLAQAFAYLEQPAPRLIAVGGTPGTGKSTLAQHIAPEFGTACGAILVRTDVLRKQMLGVDVLERLPESAYDDVTTAKTYDEVLNQIAVLLDAGLVAIADATFTNRHFRQRVETLARERNVPFQGIWLEAPLELRAERIDTRRNDPSDATPELIRRFQESPVAPTGWLQLDSSLSLEQLGKAALSKILT